MIITLYIVIGLFAGILGGLFGISGGVIVVPALFFIFRFLELQNNILMHLAIGTSLASMFFNALSATYFHARKKAVLWKIVILITPGLILGSVGGAVIANFLSGTVLKIFFGIFALLIGVYFFFQKEKHQEEYHTIHTIVLNFIGVFIAAIANMLGVGGSIFTTPILMEFKLPMQKAIGTSAAIGLLVIFMGALSYLGLGFSAVHVKKAVGYLYLPAFIILSITSFLVAPIGVKLAHILPTPVLKKIFASVLFFTGILMITT